MPRTTNNRRRAIDAARSITNTGERARPLAYVEAVRLEGNLAFRETLIQKAVVVLAGWGPDADDAAQEIARAYFAEPPRPDTTPDKRGEAMQRDLAAEPARFPAPGEAEPGADTPAGPLPNRDDGRRSVDELETAGRVIAEATLRNLLLREAAQKIGLRVRLLASRMRADRSGAVKLGAIANRLRDAAAAAGTQAEQKLPRDWIEQAIARGESATAAEAMARFSREFDQLHSTGRGPSMSRERFVELSLQTWKKTNQ
jgi:hypothetical protein